MPFHPEALTRPALKSLAKALQKAAPEILGIPVAQHQAQELLARQLGYAHWHEAYARAGQFATPVRPKEPTPRPDEGPGLTFNRLCDQAKSLYGFDRRTTHLAVMNVYDQRLISYPLTYTGYLPTSHQAEVAHRLAAVTTQEKDFKPQVIASHLDLEAKIWLPDADYRYDFHAIVPQEVDHPVALASEEQQIYRLIASAYLASVTSSKTRRLEPMPAPIPNPKWEKHRTALQMRPGMRVDMNLPPLLAAVDGWLAEAALRALQGASVRLRVALTEEGLLDISEDGPDLRARLRTLFGYDSVDARYQKGLAEAEPRDSVNELIGLALRQINGWGIAAAYLPEAKISFACDGQAHEVHLKQGEWLPDTPISLDLTPEQPPHRFWGVDLLAHPLPSVRLRAHLAGAPAWHPEYKEWLNAEVIDSLKSLLAVYANVAPGLTIAFHAPNAVTTILGRTSGDRLSVQAARMWWDWNDGLAYGHGVRAFIQAAYARNDQPLLDDWKKNPRLRELLKEHRPRRRHRPR